MKTIWILNQYAAPPEYEVRVRNNMMAHYLQEKGYKVYIISASALHNSNINLIESNEKYITKEYGDLNFIHIKTNNYKGNGLQRVKAMFDFPYKFCKYYKEFGCKPDLLICDLNAIFYPFAKHVSKKIGCPIYLEVRDLWPASIGVYKGMSDGNILMRIMYQIEKKAYIDCNRLIFSMSGGYEYIKDKKWDNLVLQEKISYICNGIDLETFEYNKKNYIYKSDILEEDRNFKVFYVGSIRTANGVKNIVDIAENLRDRNEKISFYFFGEGNERKSIEEYCMTNHIENVKFMGALNKKYIPSLLRYSNLNIIHFKDSPLKKYGSSLNKMFEYLASGIPIICDCIFYKDIINENQCGVSLDTNNPTVLADAILDFKNMDRAEYQRLSANCIRIAKEYDYKVLTNKMIDLIKMDIGE